MESVFIENYNLKLEIDYVDMLNYSLTQNEFSLIKKIAIFNNSEENEISNITLKIHSNMAFIYNYEQLIPVINSQNSYISESIDVHYNYDFFREINERIKTYFFIELIDENGEKIFTKNLKVSILPFEHWLGTNIYPQLTASYIVPNDIEVKRIVSEAGRKLEEWKGDSNFYSYQANSIEDVRLQVAAIYATLQKENIAYKYPPASFESFGQKIRYPQEIIKFKNGTCLDLTFLFASCLEAVSINPIVIFIKGHAFIGFWLKDQNLIGSYSNDYTDVSKRISIGTKEIEVVETTALVNGKDYSFEEAVQIAYQNLDNPYNFECIIDVTSCRHLGISPVATTSKDNDDFKMDFKEREYITNAPSTKIEQIKEIDYKLNPREKTDIWSRNLLDLTLRNPLINFRMNQNALQLMVYDIATLEDELSTSNKFTIINKPENLSTTNSSEAFFKANSIESQYKDLIDADFKESRIRSFLTNYMLNKQLKSLYRKAKLALEENGANSLFLAVGFLTWNDQKNIDTNYIAPILLLPLSIERKTASSNIQLEVSEEEPQLNVTLVEYLKQKFDVDLRYLADLPKDDKGVDIKRLIAAIRHAIMDKKGWDVEEIAVISNFSFKKFVMWNDLKSRKDEIISNSNVEALITGNYKSNRSIEDIDAKKIEKDVKPKDLKVGSLVDSSQLEAIKASEESSFVLHGPPGTGKSQTITNMIIHNVNQGKKVLFVAEKKAALEVVKDRLTQLEFEDFVLELHSNTTKKRQFLSKIEKTLSKNMENVSSDIKIKSQNLFEIKNNLSKYVEALHQKHNSGFSVYDLIQRYEQFEKVKSLITIKKDVVKALSINDVSNIKDLLTLIDNSVDKLSFNRVDHPLKPFEISKYSISKRDNFEYVINDFLESSDRIVDQLSELFNESNLNKVNIETLLSYKKVMDMVEKYNGSMLINQKIVEPSSIPLKTAFDFAFNVLTNYILLKEKITSKYTDEILNVKVNDLLIDYREIKDSKSLFKNKKIKNLIEILNSELLQNRILEEEEFVKDLKEIQEYQKLRETLQKRNENFLETFGEAWKGRVTDLENLENLIDFIEEYNIKEFEKDEQMKLNEILKLKITHHNYYKDLKENFDLFKKNLDSLIDDYNIDKSYLLTLSKEKLNNAASHWKKGIDDLKTWSVLNENFIKLEKILQTDIKDNFINVRSEFSIEQQLMKTLVEQFISYYFSSNETLDSFNGFDLKEKIKLLKEKVEEFNNLSIIDTKNQMSLNLKKKKSNEIYEEDFLSLQKAIRSKGRGQSIRTIFNQTSNIIQDVFPIMLMSPLSTAQYIDPNFPKFDLIIFDEASQIPTDISVGAISRAKNCIVVGDPKQMPPTSFFGSNNIDETNIELEDLESLLDDCLAANFPEKHLKWHYRSKHESLIHFSNRTYYNSNLLTYPSPTKLESQVKFKNINGVYRRGNGRVNEEEAIYIVNLLINHLKSESKDSMGVVTFNSQQQNLIENLLEERLVENTNLDVKNVNSKESIFVKNLENVQGDERDIIIFSTTFGPDEEGKMTMNFGPLNNEGGWRRLNVAITRARKEMLVISSFEPEDIDLNRTKAEGVKGLKGFLEYARNYKVLPPINRNIVRESNSIITTLQNKLEDYGYSSQINIGNSEFKIDIGILNPKDNNQFILGVLIDGENYYNSKTSIDRNIIQPTMLKSLGWCLENVWSIDWYENKNREINKILNKLKELEEESN
ncbi:DUF4011 domain-containing protein [Staphylococcus pasteuri]|uniref:DUF4011 domain-containing protein n=2 Tax=Staphylococcus pasteuri TaxID=45972 RepID=UPI0022788C83|nr:DUF4011 domain-containing protein [Staphylococcus pasteuri]WAE41813.1 DUF4011 domain-containing protein [Staphylococcus pasteuri]